MSFCICGVCIPYNVLLPVVLIFFRQIYSYCMTLLGRKNKDEIEQCKDGVCSIDNNISNCCSNKTNTTTTSTPNNNNNENNNNNSNDNKKAITLSPDHFYLDKDDESMDWKAVMNSTDKTIFVRLTAQWCGPCKNVEPFFVQQSISLRGSAHFISIDVDNHDDIAQQYRVLSIPLFIAIKNGKEVKRYAGSSKEKLVEFINDSSS